jgi:hypothetical protein
VARIDSNLGVNRRINVTNAWMYDKLQFVDVGARGQYHPRERVHQGRNTRVDRLAHPLTQVVLTSLRFGATN